MEPTSQQKGGYSAFQFLMPRESWEQKCIWANENITRGSGAAPSAGDRCWRSSERGEGWGAGADPAAAAVVGLWVVLFSSASCCCCWTLSAAPRCPMTFLKKYLKKVVGEGVWVWSKDLSRKCARYGNLGGALAKGTPPGHLPSPACSHSPASRLSLLSS